VPARQLLRIHRFPASAPGVRPQTRRRRSARAPGGSQQRRAAPDFRPVATAKFFRPANFFRARFTTHQVDCG